MLEPGRDFVVRARGITKSFIRYGVSIALPNFKLKVDIFFNIYNLFFI